MPFLPNLFVSLLDCGWLCTCFLIEAINVKKIVIKVTNLRVMCVCSV